VTPAGLALGDLRRRLVFVVVLTSGVVASLIYMTLSPILPQMAAHFGGADGELAAQLGMTMPSLGIMVAGALSGWMVARVGLRPLLLAAFAGVGVFGSAGGLFGDIWAFSVTRLLLGFSGGFLTTACIALMAELYDETGRSKMIGYWKATVGLSVMPVVLGSGALAEAFGWRMAFAMFAGLAAPVVLLGLLVVPGFRATAVAETGQGGEHGGVRRIWPIFVMIFVLHIMMMMGGTQLPLVFSQLGLTSTKTLALLISVTAPLSGVASLCSGHLQARFGERTVLCGGVALTGLGAVVIGLAPSIGLATAGNALFTLGCGAFLPLYMTMPINRVSAASRSAAIGLVQFSMYLGAFVNPLVLAPLRKGLGPDGMYLLIGSLAIAGAAAGGLRLVLLSRPRTAPAGA
jgi:MFS family permease